MNKRWKEFLGFTICALGIWFILGYCLQSDFDLVFPLFVASFLGYVYLAKQPLTWKKILWYGIVIRVGTLFFFPHLSDDIFRFYWDGLLSISGVNPYGILPNEALSLSIDGIDTTLYNQLNSPEYFTIYPPIAQLIFAISALSGSVSTAVLVMKSFFLLIEIAGFRAIVLLLQRNSKPTSWAAWYFLNPLIIVEGIGNLHYEVLMISALAWSIYYFIKQRQIISSLFLALSVGIKLLPLMLIPYLWFKLKGKDRLVYFFSFCLVIILSFLPLVLSFEAASFLNSIDLYFRKFEFNAGIYYILRYIGMQLSGYNLISYVGPILGLITILVNVLLAYRLRNATDNSYFKYAFMVWGLYLLLATTVHPWYIIPLVFLGLYVDTKVAVAWSLLVVLSYANYRGGTYFENLWVIALEYCLLLAFFIWDFRTLKVPIA